MSSDYQIRATPVTHVPGHYDIGTTFMIVTGAGRIENTVLAWMARKTMEYWGLGWQGERESVHPGAVQLVARLGLSAILDSLQAGKKMPGNIAIRSEDYGDSRPDFAKHCAYQERRDDGLFCKAAVGDDPWAGVTTAPLCAGCQMPDKMLACSELTHVKTSWFPADTKDGIRGVTEAKCNIGNDPRAGVECTPGVRECWIRRVELP